MLGCCLPNVQTSSTVKKQSSKSLANGSMLILSLWWGWPQTGGADDYVLTF